MHTMNAIESYVIASPILLWIFPAENFGEGIAQSFVQLANNLGHQGEKRDCYGIVTKEEEAMVYYAGMSPLPADNDRPNTLKTYEILAGSYAMIRISDWNQNLLHIGPTFDQILKSGLVNPSSPCIEYYISENELYCMVQKR